MKVNVRSFEIARLRNQIVEDHRAEIHVAHAKRCEQPVPKIVGQASRRRRASPCDTMRMENE